MSHFMLPDITGHECADCGSLFSTSAHLKNHRLYARYCGAELRAEKEARQAAERGKFKCEICDKEFPSPAKLRRHMLVHTTEKQFICTQCGKPFRRFDSLKYHMKSHTGEKPYSCDICGKCFKTGKCLRLHIRWHTGEKPYVCDICPNAYACSAHLRRHKKSRH